jgi:hypothetical protein
MGTIIKLEQDFEEVQIYARKKGESVRWVAAAYEKVQVPQNHRRRFQLQVSDAPHYQT